MFSEHGKDAWILKNTMGVLQDDEFSKYRDFWGDEFRWTALLPFAWKMIDYPWVEFPQLTTEIDDGMSGHNTAIAIWSTALHLLGLGMGWSDIEKGLKQWETTEFAAGYHPVLDFVKKLCGDQIKALELHMRSNKFYYLYIFSQLDEDPSQLDKKEILDSDAIDREAQRMQTLSRLSLPGTDDSLHIGMHFRDSVIGDDDFSRDFRLERLRDGRCVLYLPRYAKWSLQLKNCGAQTVNELGEFSYEEVDVQIENLGSIGLFVGEGGMSDRRRFRYSEMYREIKPGSQYISHAWGI